jgi:phenylacetate-CoA ligase
MTTHVPPTQNAARRFWPTRVIAENEPLLQNVSELDQTQWWPAERLHKMQQMQLSALLDHARENTDFYAEALQDFGSFAPDHLTDDLLSDLPIADRRTLQTCERQMVARQHNPKHGTLSEIKTSGSVSKPVTVTWNQYAFSFVGAKTFRYHQWHGSDPKKKMASLRVCPRNADGEEIGSRTRDWYPMMPGGESALQTVTWPIAQQMEWLQQEDPHYLLTYPTNALALLRHAQANAIHLPNLERIDVYGEMMDSDLPSIAREVMDCAVGDKYSSREIGEMATQCPVSGLYHIQSETVYLEVLKTDGTRAREGEVGQIIVTNLHNTAMPIIRYAIDDYAELGPMCSCGRGLPTLRRIMGRSRNMMRLESGDSFWPRFGAELLADVAPIGQVQIVQSAINDIRVLVVPLQELSAADKNAICEQISARLPRTVNLSIECVDEIPRSAGGKFEDFRCDID